MLNDDAKKYSREVLGETDETRDSAVKEIQEFLRDNKTSGSIEQSDVRTILIFLRGCKFDIEKTKKKITNYQQAREERVEWFENRNPTDPALRDLLKIGVFLPVLHKDENNQQIFVVRTGAHSPKLHKQNDVFKVGMMIIDYVMSVDEELSVYGTRAIFDMSSVSLGHALQMTPKLIRRAVGLWEAYPFRIRKLEFVNAPFHVNVVLDIFRSFMSKKLKERVHVRRGLPEFNANDHLPGELGGNGESYKDLASHWHSVVLKNQDFFIN